MATVSILQAAVGRWFLLFLAPPLPPGGQASPPPVIVSVIPALVADLLIVAAMIHDGAARQRSSGLLDRGRRTARGVAPPRSAQHVARLDCDRAMAADAGAVEAIPMWGRPFPQSLRAESRLRRPRGAEDPAPHLLAEGGPRPVLAVSTPP